MKKIVLSITVICVLLLTGCFGRNNDVIGGADGPTSVFVTDTDKTDKKLVEKYVSEISLPVLDVQIDKDLTVGDRQLILEDSIENNLELFIYEYYKNTIEGNYSEIYNMVADGSFKTALKNDEKNFKDGKYYEKILIEEIDLSDRDDIDEINQSEKAKIKEMVEKNNWEEFAVVKAELKVKFSKEYLSSAPQVGEGEMERYFLVGKPENENYKIYEFYWEGFLRD